MNAVKFLPLILALSGCISSEDSDNNQGPADTWSGPASSNLQEALITCTPNSGRWSCEIARDAAVNAVSFTNQDLQDERLFRPRTDPNVALVSTGTTVSISYFSNISVTYRDALVGNSPVRLGRVIDQVAFSVNNQFGTSLIALSPQQSIPSRSLCHSTSGTCEAGNASFAALNVALSNGRITPMTYMQFRAEPRSVRGTNARTQELVFERSFALGDGDQRVETDGTVVPSQAPDAGASDGGGAQVDAADAGISNDTAVDTNGRD